MLLIQYSNDKLCLLHSSLSFFVKPRQFSIEMKRMQTPFVVGIATLCTLCTIYFFSESCTSVFVDQFIFPYDESCHYSSAEYNTTALVHGAANAMTANGDVAAANSNAVSLTSSVRFLYLVQTEMCLPSNLRMNEALGDGHLDFHVIALSFKQRCDDNSLSHVEYIFNSSTTWTTGRNILYETAMKRQNAYLYYIFMDDDVSVIDSKEGVLAWRKFEEFLTSVQPAVAALDLPGQDYAQRAIKIHRSKRCSCEEAHYTGTLWYDAMINAFHFKAVQHLLPYNPTFDKKTWWASQMALIVRSEILFRGQVVLHREIRCRGTQNRPYPRDLNFTPLMYRQFTKGLDAYRAPGCVAKCAQIMIDQWMKFGNQNGFSSSTLCLPPPPPYDPVEPCRYQCNLH